MSWNKLHAFWSFVTCAYVWQLSYNFSQTSFSKFLWFLLLNPWQLSIFSIRLWKSDALFANYPICSTITVMTSLVALSFYGASQIKFHWVERYDKLLVGSVLCLVGILTYIFHDHDGEDHHTIEAHLNRKLVGLWIIDFYPFFIFQVF